MNSNASTTYSINLDADGIDAIMGSLYKNEGNRSLSRRKSLPALRRNNSTDTLSSFLNDTAAEADRIRRHSQSQSTMNGSVSFVPSLNDVPSNNCNWPLCDTLPKRVSFSDLQSISMFDLGNSPDNILALNVPKPSCWQKREGKIVLPPPPFHFKEKSSATAAPDYGRPSWRKHQYKPRRTTRSLGRSSSTKTKPIRVISLPWTDHRGVEGLYTGEVDAAIRPHGTGTFSTTDDDDNPYVVNSSRTWKDGRLVSAKILDYKINDSDSSTGSIILGRVSSTRSARAQLPDSSTGSMSGRVRSTRSARAQSTGSISGRVSSTRSPTAQLPGSFMGSMLGKVSSTRSVRAQLPDVSIPQPDALTPAQSTSLPPTESTTLPGYRLGHLLKHPSHMNAPPRQKRSRTAAANAHGLKPLDFAFVLRSNGTWTYSIVADRPIADGERSIRFVLDDKGRTKTIGKKYWAKGIRSVNTAAPPAGPADVEADAKHPISEEAAGYHDERANERKSDEMLNAENATAVDRKARVSDKRRSRMSNKLYKQRSNKSSSETTSAKSISTAHSGSSDMAVAAPARSLGEKDGGGVWSSTEGRLPGGLPTHQERQTRRSLRDSFSKSGDSEFASSFHTSFCTFN